MSTFPRLEVARPPRLDFCPGLVGILMPTHTSQGVRCYLICLTHRLGGSKGRGQGPSDHRNKFIPSPQFCAPASVCSGNFLQVEVGPLGEPDPFRTLLDLPLATTQRVTHPVCPGPPGSARESGVSASLPSRRRGAALRCRSRVRNGARDALRLRAAETRLPLTWGRIQRVQRPPLVSRSK